MKNYSSDLPTATTTIDWYYGIIVARFIRRGDLVRLHFWADGSWTNYMDVINGVEIPVGYRPITNAGLSSFGIGQQDFSIQGGIQLTLRPDGSIYQRRKAGGSASNTSHMEQDITYYTADPFPS